MKKIFIAIFCTITLMGANSGYAQKTEVTRDDINSLLNESRFYDIYHISYMPEEYSLSELDLYYARAMAAPMFNDYDQSTNAAFYLLSEHVAEFSDVTINLFDRIIANFFEQERYADVAEFITSNLEGEDLAYYQETADYALAMAAVPASQMIFPNKDVAVPFAYTDFGSGEVMTIECSIDGVMEQFIFDTGAEGELLVDEEFAKRHEMQIITDSMEVNGIASEAVNCKYAIGNSLKIGDLIITNPRFTISPVSLTSDGSNGGYVLGLNIISRLREVQILSEENKIIVPKKTTPNNAPIKNLMHNGSYYVFSSTDMPVALMLDSGSPLSYLNSTFYGEYEDAIKNSGVPTAQKMKDYSVTTIYSGFHIPSLDISIGGKEISASNVFVAVSPVSTEPPYCRGVMGVDILKSIKKTTINFVDMFVAIE